MPYLLGLYLSTGVLAGVCAGLLGVGGGIVFVPALLFLLPLAGFTDAGLMHIAVASSLATIVVTALGATISHNRRRSVDWSLFVLLAAGLVPGTLLGAYTARLFDSHWLERCYSVFLVIVGIHLARRSCTEAGNGQATAIRLGIGGTGIGLISAWLGIGGGTMTTPLLINCRVPLHQAIGTSAACGFPIALVASATYGILTPSQAIAAAVPFGLNGFLYWPAIVPMMLGSFLGTSIGVRFAHKTSAVRLSRIFGCFLMVLAVVILFRA